MDQELDILRRLDLRDELLRGLIERGHTTRVLLRRASNESRLLGAVTDILRDPDWWDSLHAHRRHGMPMQSLAAFRQTIAQAAKECEEARQGGPLQGAPGSTLTPIEYQSLITGSFRIETLYRAEERYNWSWRVKASNTPLSPGKSIRGEAQLPVWLYILFFEFFDCKPNTAQFEENMGIFLQYLPTPQMREDFRDLVRETPPVGGFSSFYKRVKTMSHSRLFHLLFCLRIQIELVRL